MMKFTLLTFIIVILSKIHFLEGRNFKLSIVFRRFTAFEICCNWYYYRYCNCMQQFEFCLRRSSTEDPISDANCKDGVQMIDTTRPSFYPRLETGLLTMEYLFDTWPDMLHFFIGRSSGGTRTHSIYVDEELTPHTEVTFEINDNNLHLSLIVNLGCIPNYYGSQCDVFCMSHDDNVNGHYTCNSNGGIVCRPGWSNPNSNCTIPICAYGCNETYGNCTVPNECICVLGWTGSNCDQCIPTDGCDEEGGYCINSSQCICRNYYNGSLCKNFTGDTQCMRHRICNDRGRCAAHGALDYTCHCDSGFTGDRCQINIDDCLNNPCQNQGTCVDGVNSFTCGCVPGWTDLICSTNIDDCHFGPCLNGGTCADLVNQYSCSCPSTFTGSNCETDIDECASDDNHSCVVSNGWCMNRVGNYSCECYHGFSGVNCENDINMCRSSPCFNEGTCINQVNSYTCDCPSTHTGALCNDTFCMSSPCKNSGTCEEVLGGYLCECPPLTTGRNCDAEVKSDSAQAPIPQTSSHTDRMSRQLTVVSLILIVFGILINLVLIMIIIIAIFIYKRKRALRQHTGLPQLLQIPTAEEEGRMTKMFM